MKKSLSLVLWCLFLAGCFEKGLPADGKTHGYVPVYATPAELKQIEVNPARPIENAGKIYAWQQFLFQSETGEGIHIIDGSDRTNPKKKSFLQIPGSTEIAIKGSYLYTNSFTDLLVFDIATPESPKLLKRMEDVFPAINQKYPPFTGVYFECPDPSKGVVIRWDKKMIENPNCRR